MRFTPIERLCPNVRETGRLVFQVQSRSRKGKEHAVDMERRHGLGLCTCETAIMGKNSDCWHIREARKYLAIRVVQSVLKANEAQKTHTQG